MLGIYCRISGKKAKGKDVSIEVQESKGIEFAHALGMSYKLYIDRGISGNKSEVEDRPEFSKMISDLRKKRLTAIYANSQSRIARNSMIWPIFVHEVEKAKCDYYENGKLVDFDDYITRFVTSVVALADELYSNITREKAKAANRVNAKKGKGHGITAYGYKKDENGFLVIDENQAPHVRDIFNWSNNGIGTYTIANMLNEAGVPPKSHQYKGGVIERKDNYTKRIKIYSRDKVKWRGNVIHDMIKNTVYKGERHYADVEVTIPNIISPAFWEKVNKNLVTNKKNVGPNNKFNYLLNGLIFCSGCKAEFRGKYRASGRNKTYSCKGSSQGLKCHMGRGLNIPRVESFIINHLFHSKEIYKTLTGLKIKDEKVDLHKKKLSKLEKDLKEVERAEKHFYNLLVDPELSENDAIKRGYIKAQKKLKSLNQDIKGLKTTISSMSTSFRRARIDKIFKEYDYKMNFEQVKKSVHLLIEKITVNHLPKQKQFLVQINYRGFDEKSVFVTDHQQMKWINLSHYQVVPRTDEDKQDDGDIFDYLFFKESLTKNQIKKGLEKFGNWQEEWDNLEKSQLLEIVKNDIVSSIEDESIINIKTKNIELAKHELYDFNSKPT